MKPALWFLLLGKSLQFKLKSKPLNSFHHTNTCSLTSVQLCLWAQPVDDKTVWGPGRDAAAGLKSLGSYTIIILWVPGLLPATDSRCDVVCSLTSVSHCPPHTSPSSHPLALGWDPCRLFHWVPTAPLFPGAVAEHGQGCLLPFTKVCLIKL